MMVPNFHLYSNISLSGGTTHPPRRRAQRHDAPGWFEPLLFLWISVLLLSPSSLTLVPTPGLLDGVAAPCPKTLDVTSAIGHMQQVAQKPTPVFTVCPAAPATTGSFQDVNLWFLRLFSHQMNEIHQ